MKQWLLSFTILISLTAEAHEEHESHADKSSRVGPDKGVLEADEHEGFRLRESAEKNFAIQRIPIGSGPGFKIPRSALLYSGMETQVYRQREGHWKAVDVKVVKKDREGLTIQSPELKAGDQLAIQGLGFLKIVDQSLFGPVAEGHDH